MAHFMSTIEAKIDAKGRVSVPSVFRAVIAAQDGAESGPSGIFLYPSFSEKAIEGGGRQFMKSISDMVAPLDPFSVERDAIATSLFGDSHNLIFDAGGRVVLPDNLLAHAKIDKTLCFVGLGDKFQIWHPEHYADYRATARTTALENRTLLRAPTRETER